MTIVIVAYNRYWELKRLLESLLKANYLDDKVDLVISIDYGDNEKIIEMCEGFQWKHGKKTVLKRKSNLGLRKHVLACGDLSIDLGTIIMLEDDLYVSENFYKFAKQAVDFYNSETKVAGISLYTNRLTEFAPLRPFTPMTDDCDVFFMQVPSSWGQIWTKDQWRSFREWYDKNKGNSDFFKGKVPDKVISWKESSWKKYFAMYLVDTEKYFVYPRIALSTNMGSKGTHNEIDNNSYQSILMGIDFRRNYYFKTIRESEVKYDAFMEYKALVVNGENVIVDFYGLKQKYVQSGLLLSPERLNYKIVKRWGLKLVPYELNVLNDIEGEDLFLYDLNTKLNIKNKSTTTNRKGKIINYELPYVTKKVAIISMVFFLKRALKRKVKRFFSLENMIKPLVSFFKTKRGVGE